MEMMDLCPGGPQVSALALGTWTFAGDEIWGSSEESRCIRVVHAALDRGINLFDSAPNYGEGRSEEILGKALAGKSNALVATKFKVDGQSREELRALLTASLRRLKRDSIDLMQIHWPCSTPEKTRMGLETLLSLQKEGLIRHLGFCNFGVYDLAETTDIPAVTNQLPYSLFWRVIEGDIVQACRNRSLKVMAYSVLQQGLLGGTIRDLSDFSAGRKRTRHFGQNWPGVRHSEAGMEEEMQKALNRLFELSGIFNRPLLELALAFVHSRDFMDITLIGARTEEQLNESCDAAETPISRETVEALEKATESLRTAAGGNPDMYQSESRVRY